MIFPKCVFAVKIWAARLFGAVGAPGLPAALALLCAGFLLGAPPCAVAQSKADPESGRTARETGEVVARRAMVVTANEHATAAGLEMLRAGGNAVDAVAAAQFALNVVEPQSSGIGGGGFLLIYLAERKKVIAIDGREEAPAEATPRMFLGPEGKPQPFFPHRITGGNAVGVPGLLKAIEKAVGRFGRLGLARVLQPAIRLAEEGFIVSPRMAASLKRHQKRLALFAATRQVFFGQDNQPLAAGSRIRQKDLAATFRLLAAEGSGPFYRGAIARDMVRAVRETAVNPGRLALADLAGYDAPLREPVRGSFRGYTLYGMGPPSSGGVTLFQILHILEQAPAPAEAEGGAEGEAERAGRIHRFVQAVRPAYADRARYLADPDFVSVPVAGLLALDYARRRAAQLDWAAPLAPVAAGRPAGALAGRGAAGESEHVSTTHLAVVDEARNMVALTSSVEQAFGSGMVVPGRGFFLNNQLTDFSARPGDKEGRAIANRAEGGKRPRRTALENPRAPGGKRPRSSMAPTLVFLAGRPVMALGSPGGSRIIQYVARVLVDVLQHGAGLQEAISAPHFTHLGGKTTLEPPLERAGLVDALKALGHKVRVRAQNSGLHAIRIDRQTGLLHGAADPRREGLAAGM